MRKTGYGMKLLDMADMQKIHQQMLEILKDPGLRFDLPDDELQKLAACGGIKVDFAKKRVRIGEEPVLETIRQLNGAETDCIGANGSDKPAQPHRFPRNVSGYVGFLHAYMFDSEKWDLRPTTRRDFYDLVKLSRFLPHIHWKRAGLIPMDVPNEVSLIHAMALSVKYVADGIVTDGIEQSEWIARMAEAAGLGKADDFPLMPPLVSSPLCIPKSGVDTILWLMGKGRLPYISGMGMINASGPITIDGTLSVMFAEIFGFNTLMRLLAPPENNTYSPHKVGDDMSMMEPRNAIMVLGRPEVQMLRLAQRQMAGEFYKFPGASGFLLSAFNDAAEPGIQAALENSLNVATEFFNGFYSYDEDFEVIYKSMGTLQSNLCVSLEQAVIDHDILGWLRRFTQGIDVTEDSLALDTIREIGPGGTFIATDHTLDNYKEAVWQPGLWHAGPWQLWLENGKRTLLDKAKDVVHEALKTELAPAIDDERMRDVEKLVKEAERSILGYETGMRF